MARYSAVYICGRSSELSHFYADFDNAGTVFSRPSLGLGIEPTQLSMGRGRGWRSANMARRRAIIYALYIGKRKHKRKRKPVYSV